jgi:hypothetical protein
MKDIFTELLVVDVVRGAHSTGAALVKRETNEVAMLKAAMPSPQFVWTKEYQELKNIIGVKAMIGHNRFATVGEKNEANAHPFKFDNLVGAHNGTLDNWSLRKLEDYDKFGTDSEALYYSVSKYGIKETIEKISGAWALTWFDKDTNTINMLRNSKRPLFYAYSEDRCTLFWSSEAGLLEWVLGRNNIKIFNESIFQTDIDRHYKWAIPDNVNTKFEKPTVAEVKESAFKYARNFSWSAYSGIDDVFGHHHTGALPFGKAQQKAATPVQKVDPKKFRPPYKDAYGRVMTKPEFESLVETGCVYCDSNNIHWGEFIHCLKDDMDGRKLFLCEECFQDDDIVELIEGYIED